MQREMGPPLAREKSISADDQHQPCPENIDISFDTQAPTVRKAACEKYFRRRRESR
jgi:hypothetical protein